VHFLEQGQQLWLLGRWWARYALAPRRPSGAAVLSERRASQLARHEMPG
jgi:hypothetical protein